MQFDYVCKDNLGKVYKGVIEEVDEKTLRSRLKENGFYVISINRKKESLFGSKTGKIKQDDLVVFAQQFSGMMSAGLPLVKSLTALEKETHSVALKEIINKLRLDIEGGLSLSEALEKHPKVFSDFFISSIKSGEKGGRIDHVLERLASYMEAQYDLTRKVKQAFAYPVIVGILAFLVMMFLVLFIVPIFKDIYIKMNVSLPLPTLLLVATSNFFRNYWWLLIILVTGGMYGYHHVIKIAIVRKKIDRFKLDIPIFGNLMRKTIASRFIRTFGDMLASGVSVFEAIDVARKVGGNVILSELVYSMRNNLHEGGTIINSLEDQDIIPPSVVQMIAAGEETGMLPKMLETSAKALDRDVDLTVKSLIIKIEPILTMFLAIFVGFIAIAIYMPMFELINQIGK